MRTSSPAVLLVEDEIDVRQLIAYHLRREGFSVHETDDGYECMRLIPTLRPDLIILDLMIHGLDGLQVCRLLRAEKEFQQTPVLVVSARDEEQQVLQTFALGIDDYIRKPFRVREIVARVRTLLRRAPAPFSAAQDEVLSFPPLSLHQGTYTVRLGDQPLTLTATEFRLLRFLMANPQRVFSRAQLTAQVSDALDSSTGRAIDVHIRSLRVKLGPCAAFIDTTRGVGYAFRPSVPVTGV